MTITQPNEILETLAKHRDTLSKLGVLSLAVFGSVARNEARSGSDVDILVELKSPVTFNRYMDVKFYLEDHLNRSVDLVTQKALKPELRAIVKQEAIAIS
jgi:hypothetical protein